MITAEAEAAAVFLPGIERLVNVSYGARGPFSPLMHWQPEEKDAEAAWQREVQVQVLGRYNRSGLPSLVAAVHTAGHDNGGSTRRAFFSGSPSLPAALFRSIARGAGVHIYSECADERQVVTLAPGILHECDDVAAQGNGLLLHAGNRTGTRQLSLPHGACIYRSSTRTLAYNWT